MKATTDTLHVVRNIKNKPRSLSPAVKSKARLASVDSKPQLSRQEAVQHAAQRTG